MTFLRRLKEVVEEASAKFEYWIVCCLVDRRFQGTLRKYPSY